jgi:hypothetical protein
MVNTFLPYSDFVRVAKVLDNKRLGKQRVEAKQILNVLNNAKSAAWKHHPVVLMWKGYETALKYYYNTMIDEWVHRGFVNNMEKYRLPKHVSLPWFVFCKPVLLSHRASLLRKNSVHYSKYFKVDPTYLKRSYVWISHLTERQIEFLKKHKKISIAQYTRSYESKSLSKKET